MVLHMSHTGNRPCKRWHELSRGKTAVVDSGAETKAGLCQLKNLLDFPDDEIHLNRSFRFLTGGMF